MLPAETVRRGPDQLAKASGRIFSRDVAIQPRIARAIDLAHTPGPKGGKDFVRAKACAGVEGQTAAIEYRGRAAAPTGLLLSDVDLRTNRGAL